MLKKQSAGNTLRVLERGSACVPPSKTLKLLGGDEMGRPNSAFPKCGETWGEEVLCAQLTRAPKVSVQNGPRCSKILSDANVV